ncbi:MAG: diacylglycerol kinase family protein [Muribaculaceae bacterium]|nr:diacylglycerol kinase family protein [Muribaculaceae bacterium]MDE6769005.1 diacylglycerol kinase family protein [Muribaculaceae bacterium]
MEKESKFSWKKRGKAFIYAWQGFKALLRYEHNARIHLVAAVVAICAGIIFGISAVEWCVVVMCIGLVIAAEALNSAVEALADKISPDYDPLIGRAKDLGATAVTLLALVAAAVGCIVYLPYIIRWFS